MNRAPLIRLLGDHGMIRCLLSGMVVLLVLVSDMQFARAEEGIASVYGNEHGQYRRADGKRFIPSQIVCAHRSRKLGSIVRVTNLKTGRSIVCPIRDRGPYARGRILDLSTGAARALGIRGLAKVKIE
jgi:rare lipoprotein A